jgi:hypothetical protein
MENPVTRERFTIRRSGPEEHVLEPGGRLGVAPRTPHTWDMYLAGPPVPLQRALFTALGPLARLRGYRTSYERFEHAG